MTFSDTPAVLSAAVAAIVLKRRLQAKHQKEAEGSNNNNKKPKTLHQHLLRVTGEEHLRDDETTTHNHTASHSHTTTNYLALPVPQSWQAHVTHVWNMAVQFPNQRPSLCFHLGRQLDQVATQQQKELPSYLRDKLLSPSNMDPQSYLETWQAILCCHQPSSSSSCLWQAILVDVLLDAMEERLQPQQTTTTTHASGWGPAHWLVLLEQLVVVQNNNANNNNEHHRDRIVTLSSMVSVWSVTDLVWNMVRNGNSNYTTSSVETDRYLLAHGLAAVAERL